MFSQIFREHKGRWKQIFILAKTDLIKTYKGSLLGPIWALVKPLFTLFVFWFAFRIGIRNSGDIEILGKSYPFFMFMLPGFVAWFFMQDCILGGSKTIRKNSQFVQKMSFPVSTIMTFSTLSFLFVHLIITTLMYIYFIIMGAAPSIYNLQFFFYCPLMYMFFLVLTWSTATMTAFSKDFGNLINSIMTGFFWLSGIVWNSYGEKIPSIIQRIMLLNPINYFANGYRKAFLYNEWFWERPYETLAFFVIFALFFFLGIYNYKRLRYTLPDVL